MLFLQQWIICIETAFSTEILSQVSGVDAVRFTHPDSSPENILIADDVLKLADFGSCRGMYTKQPYTEYISTRWSSAPFPLPLSLPFPPSPSPPCAHLTQNSRTMPVSPTI